MISSKIRSQSMITDHRISHRTSRSVEFLSLSRLTRCNIEISSFIFVEMKYQREIFPKSILNELSIEFVVLQRELSEMRVNINGNKIVGI